MTNTINDPIDATNGKFIPDYWDVYVIEDPLVGYFAGYAEPGYAEHGICVPLFCNTIVGARKFDAFRDFDARGKALAIMKHDRELRERGKLWCYRRCDIYPEEY